MADDATQHVVSRWRRTVRDRAPSASGGALALGILFLLDFLQLRLDFMGYSDDRAVSRIIHEYGADIVRGQLALLGVMLFFGAVFGALGGAVVEARWGGPAGVARVGTRVRFAAGFAVALVAHALLLSRHLVRYPQLYAELLYDTGGLKRSAMVALTRHTSPRFYVALGVVLLAIALPTRRYADRAARAMRRGAWRGVTIAAVALVTAAFVVFWPRRGPHGGRPNVLLVAVDSLRADRVFPRGDGSGEEVARFPTIEALANKSVRFTEAHVTVPRTFPSFVTLLTGRYPHHHGIRHMFPSEAERLRIERSGPSLPTTLVTAGYQSAVVSDFAGEIFSRTPIGFQTVDVPRFDMHTIVAERGLQLHLDALPYAAGIAEQLFPFVRALSERADPELLTDRAVRELDRMRKDAPFFLTVFYSTAHFPYAAPYPYYERFADPHYEGPFLYEKPPLSPAAVHPDDARQIQALYDGSVAAVDHALGRLFAALDRRGLADDTIVILLADHGENLWDDPRAGMGHGDHFVGDHADHVPLLVYDPRRPFPHDVSSVVRDIDVTPTVAALVGVAAPAVDGVDLGPLIRGEKKDLELPAFSETEYWFIPSGPGFQPNERLPYPAVTGATDLASDGDVYMRPEYEPAIVTAKHRALRLGDWKLVYRPTRGGVRWSLYDVRHDADEQHDRSGVELERLAVMRDFLYAWMLDDPQLVRRGDFVVAR